MLKTIQPTAVALLLTTVSSPSFAVEGGAGAYLLGSREGFAGVVPGPGTYVGIDLVHMEGDIQGLSMGGLPIKAKTDLKVSFAKLSVTQVLDAELWGGTLAFNIVRRQSFWVQVRPKISESLAHLVGLIMRRVACDASGALRGSFV